MYHKRKKNYRGFTLIELLVTVTIVAFLMGLGLVSYGGSRKAARDNKRKADLEQIRSVLEIYRSDCKQYPPGVSSGVSLKGCPGDASQVTYIDVVPSDPGNCAYFYQRTGTNTYVLCASLETGGNTAQSDCGSCGSGCVCNYKMTNP